MTITFASAARPGGGLSLARPAPAALAAEVASATPRPVAGAGAATLLAAGIGELVVTNDPAVGLIAYGLGSCVALSLWDARARVGALAHFMLPSGAGGGTTPVKFVDSGLPALLSAFEAKGGTVRIAQLKAAGGAAMLSISTSAMEIGRRNGEAVEAALAARGLRLAATDLGGTTGRTVQLDIESGRLHVRGVGGAAVL